MGMTPPTLLFAGARLSGTRPARIRLRRQGARVLLAGGPEEGLRRALEDAPDLVVFEEDDDGRWPPDWLERLRALRPDVDLVVLESRGSAGARGLGLGVLYSGPQPISTGTLVGIVDARFPGRLLRPTPLPAVRIVCVDDDPRWLATLERTLVRRGYDVALFDNAPAALEALKRSATGAALVDIMMPGMDGLELTEKITLETGGHVPVVLLTALDSDEAWHEGHRRGARFFVTKTSEPGRLVDVVDLLAADLDEPERQLLQAQL